MDKALAYKRELAYWLFLLLASGLNYLVYPALARTLSIEELGVTATLLSVTTQTSGVFIVINLISIHYSKNSKRSHESLTALRNFLLSTFFVLNFFLILLASPISKVLKLNDSILIILVGVILFLSAFISFWTGYLQGKNNLIRAGFLGFIIAFFQLTGAILLSQHLGVRGVLIGFIVGIVSGGLIFYIVFRRSLTDLFKGFHFFENIGQYSSILRYATWSSIAIGVQWALQSLDQIILQVGGNKELTGLYGGVSIYSKAFFFLGMTFIWTLLPSISVRSSSKNKKIFLAVVSGIVLSSIVGFLTLGLMGDRLTTLLLGDGFSDGVIYISPSIIFKLSILITTFFTMVFIIKKEFWQALLPSLIAAGTTAIAYFFTRHESFQTSLSAMAFSNIAGFFLCYLLLCKLIQSNEK